MYEIARHLPLEARKSAARREYRIVNMWPRTEIMRPWGLTYHCPLGVILMMENDEYDPCPEPDVFIRDMGLPEELEAAAEEFVHAWDAGGIDNLAEALGVEG